MVFVNKCNLVSVSSVSISARGKLCRDKGKWLWRVVEFLFVGVFFWFFFVESGGEEKCNTAYWSFNLHSGEIKNGKKCVNE